MYPYYKLASEVPDITCNTSITVSTQKNLNPSIYFKENPIPQNDD